MKSRKIRAAVASVLCAAGILAMAGCGNSSSASKYPITLSIYESYFEKQNDDGSTGKVDVEGYMGKPSGKTYKYSVGADGMVHLQMTQDFYSTFRQKMVSSVEDTFKGLEGGSGTEYVRSIEANSSYTNITVQVNPNAYPGKENDKVPSIVGLAACIYQQFTPQGVSGCTVRVLNWDTSAVIASYHYPATVLSQSTTTPTPTEGADAAVDATPVSPSASAES